MPIIIRSDVFPKLKYLRDPFRFPLSLQTNAPSVMLPRTITWGSQEDNFRLKRACWKFHANWWDSPAAKHGSPKSIIAGVDLQGEPT